MRHGFKADPMCEACEQNSLLEEMRMVLIAEWSIPPEVSKQIYCRNCTWISHEIIREQIEKEPLL